MKLIIDIPESMYEGVMMDRVLDTTVIRILDEIKNGTPLDKIREEIEQASYEHYFEYGEYIGEDTRKKRIINTNKALEIIDHYREGEQK